MKYIHVIVGILIAGCYFPGLSFVDGVTVDLIPQPCMPEGSGLQTAVFKDAAGNELARANVSAISDVRTSDETIDGFAVLHPA